MDYYSILGVTNAASKTEIKTAYRERKEALAAKDESSAKNEAARTANRLEGAALNEAWNVLSDQSQRDRYDADSASRDSEAV
ncbi:MAG: DnaJ domain-containing protein, partial [Acidimicrobiia bacterium]|nr:DnaJ domain-containing protein [Acidimicrobiia bacterium]